MTSNSVPGRVQSARALMRNLVIVATATILIGCQTGPELRGVSDLTRELRDKEVDFVLNEDLMIRAGRARVFLQDGRVVGGRNLYRPHCIMEIDSIDHTGFRVAAEPFRVSRVQRSTVQIARRDHFRVALRMVASSAYDGGVDRFHDGYHFWLTSDTQPEVMRLTCYGVYAAPIDLYPPTVEEINAALGQIGALRGDGNVVP